ncbi:Frag1/DRAM/Sfk1 family-domain-containing protein [Amylocystis lapponica]|nr:Frag1/DRAM/Sfk1 family-domain-containing protein [Amylocystis lapponica]
MTPHPAALSSSAFPASHLARAHTVLSLAAFLAALLLGCALHYERIVKNGVAGYPHEWFPSVSATIGDWYPERNIFQILIALNSGPRFALVYLQYCLHRTPTSRLPALVALCGVLRTLSCGGWVYITSIDDHDAHDILMISYIVLNIPWMFGTIACTPPHNISSRHRRFFTSMIPMVYFFVQHKVYRVPGAYTRYSFFEWGLIVFDILYDSATELDLKAANLQVRFFSVILNITPYNSCLLDAVSMPPSANAETVATYIEKLQRHRRSARPYTYPRPSATWRDILGFMSTVYRSFVFWSIITSLTPTLFYFSVWELGIAGHELALLSTVSPCLLAIPPFLHWCCSATGRTTLYLLSLTGIAAYALNSPLQRLFVVSFASAVACIGAAADWSGVERNDVGYQGIVAGLGFILSSVAKHANHSNNPVWPIVHEQSGGYNKTGLFLACLAVYGVWMRPTVRVPKSTTEKANSTLRSPPPSTDAAWLSGGIALGALLFLLHYLLSDASTLVAWSWTGYPISGPVPHLHGSLTHVAQVCGLALPLMLSNISTARPQISCTPCGSHTGALPHACCTAAGMARLRGGLNFAVFLMSVVPAVLQRAASAHVAKTYGTAWLVVSLFQVASVFTVAYAFVPGGAYFRERTDLVLGAAMAGLALAFRWRPADRRVPSLRLPGSTGTFAKNTLAVFSVLSLLVTLYRSPVVPPAPHRPGARLLRAGIWTVHFGIDNEGRDSQRRMRDLIKDMELDVVGLLETDLHRTVFGNRDLTRVMAEELGFFVDIGPGPNSHTWGAVLLSKFPIIRSTHHLLPSPDGELAPAIEADLDIYGTTVKVIVAHNGQEETPRDRELQATELARIMAASYPQPLIFLGYVVTKPLAARPAPYEIMVSDGRVHDIDREDWDRWCEYIFYRGLYRTSYARVSRSTITDTELQIGQFALPRHGSSVTNDSSEARYMRAWKEDLPEDHWFPMAYYPQEGGRRGHHYHVFNTPLYYKIPEGAEL